MLRKGFVLCYFACPNPLKALGNNSNYVAQSCAITIIIYHNWKGQTMPGRERNACGDITWQRGNLCRWLYPSIQIRDCMPIIHDHKLFIIKELETRIIFKFLPPLIKLLFVWVPKLSLLVFIVLFSFPYFSCLNGKRRLGW